MMALPTGVVTFLFSDIEGSTRLHEADPVAYRAALARHEAIIEEAIASHGGVAFVRAGDSFSVAFTNPGAALRAAIEAQQALHREQWKTSGPLNVRMALHTGEVEVRDGQYFGLALNRVARLMSSAWGGQTVVSSVTAGLIGESLPAGVSLTPLGEHRLRDLAHPEQVFQLAAPGLLTAFPPLRTLSSRPNNLPFQATAFVGREQQIEGVRRLLVRTDVRLLTLTGPGGTGKTRLALQAAGELLESFPDGVFFVPLMAVTDPDLVPSAIAQALDVREAAGRTLQESLRDFLGQKQLLLVLDNLEQLLPAGPHIAELIATAPGLKALVTSRAVLRLYGEREYPVPPLALPDRRTSPSAAHLAQFESVRLFVERAQDARPDFALTNENASEVADICHRLDGLPLAIELAAARIRSLPPRAMLQRMERRLPLLTGGARDLPARQRTLRDAIGWSYDLLGPDEQVLFRRLAVFRGCSLEGAEAVCAGEPARPGATSVSLPPLEIEILDGLESLVEKSLLRQDAWADGEPWYLMLETIREFAQERLEGSGEAEAVHRRHALRAMHFAEQAETALFQAEQATWFARVEQAHDNLREALSWCEERGYAEPAYRLCISLWWFWSVHGHVAEGRERLASVLTRFPVQPTSKRAGLRARALVGASMLASFQADYVEARALGEEGLALRRAIGDPGGIFSSLESLGTASWIRGDHAAARRYAEEAIAIAEARGDRRGWGMILNLLGNVSLELGDIDVARSYFAKCDDVLSEGFDIHGVILSLAMVAYEQGRYDEAERIAYQALDRFRKHAMLHLEALALATLGAIALARDEPLKGREHLRASVELCRSLGDPSAAVQVLERFVELAAALGLLEGALILGGAAEALRERAGAPRSPRGQVKLNEALGPARRALPGAVGDAAWRTGRALSLDDAVARALAMTDAVPAPSTAPASVASSPASPPSAVSVLTPREREVATLIGQGLTNRQIAEALVITEGTAANHVVHILNKLGHSSRAQIAVWAAASGLLPHAPSM